jgi:hypothetical protein
MTGIVDDFGRALLRLNTYPCRLLWFDEWKDIEVIANQGESPLLGIGMLRTRVLTIDYPQRNLIVQ